MKDIRNKSRLWSFAVALGMMLLWSTQVLAQSSYFTSRGCVDCHGSPVVATCNGCHHHGDSNLSASTNKSSYAPGEAVTVTLTGGSRTGWISARLYNQSGVEIARPTGNQSGMGSSTTFPAVLTAPAPSAAGSYTWKMAYFGNEDGSGAGDVHSDVSVNVTFSVVAAGDTTKPVVSAFTLPATATSLTVAVSSFTATDNVAVSGYLIDKVATGPLASAAGWTATAPTSVTAVSGSNTFYAWAKDAAGNVSLSRSASVTVTLPPAADTTKPVVGTFTLPATATSLTVAVSSFTATDNVAVSGYMINKSATAPLASATGWSATAPASVTAVSGSNTFYAWAKDAAGNVSLSRSASVTVTLPPAADTTKPVVGTFTLPATATSLSVAVSSFTATDNVAVSGYMINKSATAPLASASGWSASAPAIVTAVSGSNTFYAWAKDAAGNVSLSRSASVTVTLPTTGDTTKPTLTVSTLPDDAFTNNITLNISGNATDTSGIKSVTVNDQSATVMTGGTFSTALTLVAGANTITVVATDNNGNQQSDVRTINYDPIAPQLTVAVPADNSVINASNVSVSGTVSETSTVVVTNNSGSPQSASMTGNSYSANVNLVSGVNTISIVATDLAGNTASAKRTVSYNTSSKLTLAVTYPSQDTTTRRSTMTLTGTVTNTSRTVTVTITMDGRTYTQSVTTGIFRQALTFTRAKLYAITVTAKDAAGNTSSVTRNVIYRPESSDDDERDSDGTTSGTTSHPFGWTDPRSSHPNYVERNGVSGCISCHSIDLASKGQKMSCYNCHGKEWTTPTTTGGSTGGTTGGTTSHPFGWTNPRSSHPSYVERNGVSGCISCHSIDLASKGQPMSCYNCHGKEWTTPTTTGGSTGGTTSHPFGWTDPRSSHPNYVETNGVSGCVSCHSTDLASKGQAMSCYNCHGKEW